MLTLTKPFEGWTRDMHTAFVCTQGLRPDTANCLVGIPIEMRVLLEQSWHTLPSIRPTTTGIINDLRVLEEKQLLLIEEMQIQFELSRQLEVAKARQEVVGLAATAVLAVQKQQQQQQVDMAYLHAAQCSPQWKHFRRGEPCDDMTAETALLSYLSDDSY